MYQQVVREREVEENDDEDEVTTLKWVGDGVCTEEAAIRGGQREGSATASSQMS